jgi:hypothetical protein
VPGSALSATAGLPASSCDPEEFSRSSRIAQVLISAGANPQHVVETLDSRCTSEVLIARRKAPRAIGALRAMRTRAVSAQEK